MIALGTLFSIVFGTLTGVISAWRRGHGARQGGPVHGARLLLDADAVARPADGPVRRRSVGLPTSGIEDPTLGILGDADVVTVVVDRLQHMILPALTLGLVLYGDYALIMRSAMLETLGEDYVLTARAKGLSNWAIVRKHGFRNALLPIVTLIALSLGFIIGGSITIEYVFSYPGIGLATVEAIDQRDWPRPAGDLPPADVLGDPLQPDRRPPLREARPAGGRGDERHPRPPTASTRRPPSPTRRDRTERPRLGFLRSSVLRQAGDDHRPRRSSSLFVLVAIFAPLARAVRPEGEDRRRLRAARRARTGWEPTTAAPTCSRWSSRARASR